jgi:hypothetical protein
MAPPAIVGELDCETDVTREVAVVIIEVIVEKVEALLVGCDGDGL